MKEDQTNIKQHACRYGRDHHSPFTKALHVIACQNHRRNFQPSRRPHQDPGQLVRQAQFKTYPQWHINDVHGVAGPHQRGGNKQHTHIFVLPTAGLFQRHVYRLLHPRDRRQYQRNQHQANGKNPCGNGKHRRKAVIQRQHECQWRSYHPGQRKLRTHHRAKHHHFTRGVISIFSRQRKQLRHGGVRQRGQQHTAGDQREIVAIKGKQQRIANRHQAAKHDQLAPIALAVGSFREAKADDDPDNRIDGVKQPDPKWLRPDFTAQEQTQGGCLQCPRHAHHKSDQHKCRVNAVEAPSHGHNPEHIFPFKRS